MEPAPDPRTPAPSTGPTAAVEARLQLILDQMPTVLWTTDRDLILCSVPWGFDYGWGQLLSTFFLGVTQPPLRRLEVTPFSAP